MALVGRGVEGGESAAAADCSPSAVSRMRRILVINAKGGCGKTTLATNLAGYYAANERKAAILDYDPQGSSMHWLSLRQAEAAPIHGLAAHRDPGHVTRSWAFRLPAGTDRLILDAPAGVTGGSLITLVREADVILIPVLPSPIDIHAAARFIEELLLVGKVRLRDARVGVVANRVRENTVVYQSLERFLRSLRIPFVGMLRDSQGYVRAAEAGLSIHEAHGSRRDREQWERLISWIEQESQGEALAGGSTPVRGE